MNHEQTLIDQFNLKHPVGSMIKFTNEKGETEEREIRAEAEFARSLEPLVKFSYESMKGEIKMPVSVVYVNGRYDAIHLNDVVK